MITGLRYSLLLEDKVTRLRRAKHMLAILVAGLGVASCGDPHDEQLAEHDVDETQVASASQTLNGVTNFDDGSCVEADNLLIPRIRAAITEARRTLMSPLMDDCVMNAWGAFSSSGFAERLLSEMRENVPTTARCDRNLIFDASTPGGNLIIFRNASVFVGTVKGLAALVLHEVAHTKGFSHPGKPDNDNLPAFSFANSPEYRQSFNEQVSACSLAISDGHPRPVPAGGRRDDRFPGTTLAPVGGAGGHGFEQVCDAAMGLRGRSGALIDAIGPSCILAANPPLAGSQTGGGPFTMNCQSGELLVGVLGTANADTLVGIGPLCQTATSVQQRRHTVTDAVSRGFRGSLDGGSTLFKRWCPPGMYVNALRGRAGALVDRLEIDCATVSSTGVFSPFVSEAATAQAGGNGGAVKIQKCTNQSVVTGLHYQADDWSMIRMGGECSDLTKSCSGSTCTETVGNNRHLLLAEGGTGGKVGWHACPVGSALIGMTVHAADGLVKGVIGRCAPVTAWAGTGSAPTVTFTPRFPSVSNPTTVLDCPRGSFVTGWHLRTGVRVDAVTLKCRNF